MRLMWQAQVTQYTQLGKQYANAVREGMPGGMGMGAGTPPEPPMGYMDPMVTYGAVIETGNTICTQIDVFLDKVGKISS
jgi:hypothetical protein